MSTAHQWLVIDLEATCSESGRVPKAEQEVIEIGAVVIDPDAGWQIVKEFQSFVRPVIHPKLTGFCRSLTGIRQSDVDAARPFPAAFGALLEAVGPQRGTWASWGRFDRDLIAAECERYGLDAETLGHRHVDLSAEFRRATGRRRGHRWAMQFLGVPAEGSHHRGLDDARNVARTVPRLLSMSGRRIAS